MRKRLVICVATLALFASVIPVIAASNGKVVFASGRNSVNGIWVMDSDGTGATSLISNIFTNSTIFNAGWDSRSGPPIIRGIEI